MRHLRVEITHSTAEQVRRDLRAAWIADGEQPTSCELVLSIGRYRLSKCFQIDSDMDFGAVADWAEQASKRPLQYDAPVFDAVMSALPMFHVSHAGDWMIVRTCSPPVAFGRGRQWVDVATFKGADAEARVKALLIRFQDGENGWSLKSKH